MKTNSAQFLKKKKFFTILPVLTLPFITLALWAMGLGSAAKEEAPQQQGLNKELPTAKLSTDPFDKMSLYDKAHKDSLAKQQTQPFGPFSQSADSANNRLPDAGPYGDNFYNSGRNGLQTYTDPNEAKIRDRLDNLERVLREPGTQSSFQPQDNDQGASGMGSDLDRLEQMMQSMTDAGSKDPEMQQLSGMLAQIQEIQNPGLAQQKLKELSQKNKGRAYAVSTYKEENEAPLIARADAAKPGPETGVRNAGGNGFYDIGSTALTDMGQNAIPAVIHETQTLTSGSTVKMRLVEDIFINGTLIPSGNFIYGTCTLNGERLNIEINGVRFGKNLYPVSLNVYDLDALEGIHIPGALSRDASKEGADRALQSVQFMSLDQSMASQAAGAGVEVAKGLFSKKAKLIRVTVKAGYPLLLMDDKERQEQSH